MKYRNTKTGAVIDVKSKVKGKFWEAVEPSKKEVESTAPKAGRRGGKKAGKKTGTDKAANTKEEKAETTDSDEEGKGDE